MEILNFLPATAAGFTAFHLTKFPHGRIGKRLPNIKFHRFQFSPTIKVDAFGKKIHMHHWMNLLILLAISVPMTNAVLDNPTFRAFIAGGVIQGLTFSDRLKIIHQESKA